MKFEQAFCMGEVMETPNHSDLTVNVTITEPIDDGIVRFLAASPPDYRYNYSGSALPWANPTQAFQNTPNKGTVGEISGNGNMFSIKLLYPNSYYVGLGTVLVPPMLSLFYTSGGEEKTKNIQIADSIPYRYLTYPKSSTYNRTTGPTFYDGTSTLPIRTQEQILISARYPPKNKTPEDFWGLKPRC